MESRCFLYHLQMWTLHLLQECLHWRFYLWSGFILFFHLQLSCTGHCSPAGMLTCSQMFDSPSVGALWGPAALNEAPPHSVMTSLALQTMAHRCKRGDNGGVCAPFTNSMSESNSVIILLICPYAQLCSLVPRWEDLTCALNSAWLKQSHDVRPSQNISEGDDQRCLQGICQIRHVTWKCLLINKNLVPKHLLMMIYD